MVAKKKKYVSEAKKLGLSCGVTEKLCSVQTPSVCSDKELCMYSSNGVNWTSNNTLKKYVNEAKRRGLDCGIKGINSSKKCTDVDRTVCTNQQVCEYARKTEYDYIKNNYPWNDYDKVSVAEAKRRGLTCNVYSAPTDFRQAFISQSQLRRKQLQYALKELRFYTYGVDGLWGKGTKKNF